MTHSPIPSWRSRTRPVGGAPVRDDISPSEAVTSMLDVVRTRQKLKLSLYVLVTLLLIGASGFMLLGDDRSVFESIYVTLLILTTVGMKEASIKLNEAEQAWAVVLMVAGISTALYAAGNLVALIIEGDLRRMFGRRQLKSKIDRLDNHYIVCGFGRMGRALCRSLADKGVPFVLIELDTARTTLADELGYLYVVGDATLERVLQEARIDKAAGLATCLQSDADNVFVTLTARELNAELQIIARAERSETEPKLKRAGANRVICLPVLGANKITRMLLTPAVEELLDLAVSGPDIEVSKVRMTDLPLAVGHQLKSLHLGGKTGTMVVAVVHEAGHRTLSPPPDLTLKQGDELIVVGAQGSVSSLVQRFGSKHHDTSDALS